MDELFNRLNIKPNDLTLYNIAFSHSSYANEHKAKSDYERLEFLGDAIVDMVVAEYFYRSYSESEGQMTKERASYVCENALYEYSINLGLDKYLKLGHGEEKSKEKKAIVADIFESFVAAMYLDLGFATTRRFILDTVVPYIENPNINFFSDYKSALQEYVQSEQNTITYEIVKEEGPAHNKLFTVRVLIDDIEYGEGTASSKKDAEQEAAKKALEKMVLN